MEIIEDLVGHGVMCTVDQLAIEYHHNMSGSSQKLSKLLEYLERLGFDYQIDAACTPLGREPSFQDVLIRAHRRR